MICSGVLTGNTGLQLPVDTVLISEFFWFSCALSSNDQPRLGWSGEVFLQLSKHYFWGNLSQTGAEYLFNSLSVSLKKQISQRQLSTSLGFVQFSSPVWRFNFISAKRARYREVKRKRNGPCGTPQVMNAEKEDELCIMHKNILLTDDRETITHTRSRQSINISWSAVLNLSTKARHLLLTSVKPGFSQMQLNTIAQSTGYLEPLIKTPV